MFWILDVILTILELQWSRSSPKIGSQSDLSGQCRFSGVGDGLAIEGKTGRPNCDLNMIREMIGTYRAAVTDHEEVHNPFAF